MLKKYIDSKSKLLIKRAYLLCKIREENSKRISTLEVESQHAEAFMAEKPASTGKRLPTPALTKAKTGCYTVVNLVL